MKGTFKGNLKQALPMVMSGLACTGVVATAVLSVKATPKALTLLEEEYGAEPPSAVDAVKTCWKLYLPAVGVGLGTIGLIIGAHCLNRRMQASLASAYGLMNSYYRDYQKKVKEVVGEEKEREIRKAIAQDKYEDAAFIDIDLLGVPSEEKALFYDPWGQRYFTALTEDVRNAEYHVNRNFALKGAVGVNEFYTLMGVEPLEELVDVGWSIDDEFTWIDFEHSFCKMDDGMECYILGARFDPVIGYEYGYWDAWEQELEREREREKGHI